MKSAGMRSFTDPALVIGGGVRLALTPHLAIRPDRCRALDISSSQSIHV